MAATIATSLVFFPGACSGARSSRIESRRGRERRRRRIKVEDEITFSPEAYRFEVQIQEQEQGVQSPIQTVVSPSKSMLVIPSRLSRMVNASTTN